MEHYKKRVHRLVKEFWSEDLKDVKVSVSEMEIPFEISPCSVNEIASYLDVSDGISFRKYNTQSGTAYLTKNNSKTEVELPNGLSTRIPDDFDSIYVNGINGDIKKIRSSLNSIKRRSAWCV